MNYFHRVKSKVRSLIFRILYKLLDLADIANNRKIIVYSGI
jgi:hypothetical protein